MGVLDDVIEAYQRKVLPVHNASRSAYTPDTAVSNSCNREPFGRVLLAEMGKIRGSRGENRDNMQVRKERERISVDSGSGCKVDSVLLSDSSMAAVMDLQCKLGGCRVSKVIELGIDALKEKMDAERR